MGKHFFFFVVEIYLYSVSSMWLTKEVGVWAIQKFEELEAGRRKNPPKGTDRRASTPFITGDGFRLNASHICEDVNR